VNRRGPLNRIKGIAHELSVLRRFKPTSWPRLAADILVVKAERLVAFPRATAPRTITMRNGTRLTYRRNRGDLQAIREIWLDEVYRPPPETQGLSQVVDLGANIGFTSLYLARHLPAASLVAVEPDPDNARLLRHNLMQNGINGMVIEAAVGPSDGTTTFLRDRASNLGRVSPDGELKVAMVSVATVLRELGPSTGRHLLKLDIEGGEEQLFTGDLGWLAEVDCLLAELHPEAADVDRITASLEIAGLRCRVPASSTDGPVAYWARSDR
jgi:FkbM family methyltransferase